MSRKKKTRRDTGRKKAAANEIDEQDWAAVGQIVELTDAFCKKYLNDDYRELCEDMALAAYEEGLPLHSGKPVGWASGIVYALGRVNFLQDPAQSPHMTTAQIAEGFGVSQATMMAKSKIIREALDLFQMHPDWCVPAMLENNPLVWMLSVNGVVMDIRLAPREAQEEAYRLGFIPYIPADEEKSVPESDNGPKVIRFTSGQNETSGPATSQQPEDSGPNLFDGLKE